MDKATNLIRKAQLIYTEYWKSSVFMSITWWMLLILLVFPWLIWWKLTNKRRLLELASLGLFIIIVARLMDTTGTALGLWEYPYKIYTLPPELVPVNLSVIPVIHLLIYEKTDTWKGFILAEVIFSIIAVFIMEPLSIYLNMYRLIRWKLIYSLPIHIAIGIIGKLFIERIKKMAVIEK